MTIPLTGPEIPLVVRTDDARFANLPGYPFEPNYVQDYGNSLICAWIPHIVQRADLCAY